MAIIEEIFTTIFGIIRSVAEKILEIAPKVISFLLWIILAIIILPCVFIAGEIYPKWVKWGEGL